jgi:hypothetical protein
MNIYVVGWIAAAVLLLTVAIYAMSQESKHWDEFSRTHECKLISVDSGDSVPVIGANGQLSFAFVPGKKGYKCNDGVTYYR